MDRQPFGGWRWILRCLHCGHELIQTHPVELAQPLRRAWREFDARVRDARLSAPHACDCICRKVRDVSPVGLPLVFLKEEDIAFAFGDQPVVHRLDYAALGASADL
jgi:hypothetical protein